MSSLIPESSCYFDCKTETMSKSCKNFNCDCPDKLCNTCHCYICGKCHTQKTWDTQSNRAVYYVANTEKEIIYNAYFICMECMANIKICQLCNVVYISEEHLH